MIVIIVMVLIMAESAMKAPSLFNVDPWYLSGTLDRGGDVNITDSDGDNDDDRME